MASIMTGSIDVTKIDKSKIEKGKYYKVAIVSNDEVGQFGDSGYIAEGQTKEQREAKAPKNFLGNFKVVWTNGDNVAVPPRDDMPVMEATAIADEDLPF